MNSLLCFTSKGNFYHVHYTYHSFSLNHWSHPHKHVNRCFHYNQKTCHVLLSFSEPVVQRTYSSPPHSGGKGHLRGTHVRLLCLILTVAKYLKKGGKKVKNTLLLHDRIPPNQDLSFNTKTFLCGASTIAHGEMQTTLLQCLLYTESMRMCVTVWAKTAHCNPCSML